MNMIRNFLNKGLIQGIVVNDIYSPNDNVSVVTVRVKDSRINPQTGKRSLFFVQLSAFGETAQRLRQQCQKGQLLYAEYYLATSRKTDEKGVTAFYRSRVISDFTVGELLAADGSSFVPYLNFGVVQGDFVSLRDAPNADHVAFLTIRVPTEVEEERERVFYLQMSVYGSLVDFIRKNYNANDSIGVLYKVETSVKVKNDEKKYLMDYVVTSLM